MPGVPERLKQQWCDEDGGEWFVTIDEWRQVVELLPLARGGNRSILAIADRHIGSVAVLQCLADALALSGTR